MFVFRNFFILLKLVEDIKLVSYIWMCLILGFILIENN